MTVLVVSGACASGSSSGSTPSSPSGVTELTGSWTGRANGVEPADFSLSLTQSGAVISGSGQVFFPGDQSRLTLSVAGTASGSSVTLRIQPGARSVVTYQATADGRTMSGWLTGGDIQHDGPFSNTSLTLQRQ